MRVGVVVLPEHRWEQARAVWRGVEDMGFDHAWTYDHLSWRSLREGPWFGTYATLTAAATVTERIRLGTLVTSPNFRHPVTWAKEIMSIDDISGGRVIAGIGAGGGGYDAEVLGQAQLSAREKALRFHEFVELADGLLRRETHDYEGRFYTARGARMAPGCVQRPRVPFAIAATGPRGLRLAARFGQMWVTNGDPKRFAAVPEAESLRLIRDQLRQFGLACEEAGRDVAEVATMVNGSVVGEEPLASVERFVDFAGSCAQAGFTDLTVHYPRPEGPFASDLRVFERIARDALPVVRRMQPAPPRGTAADTEKCSGREN
ncbi:LLM class flavin-dependent oxidoreductase [Streptomyces sp. NPDC006134]|uniref:LLM class flavin-dependent oxidoreductase n=1 Tax=Streptomyces sp. NPDC006134 TaxID=3154467 RepID=UPI0033F0F12A